MISMHCPSCGAEGRIPKDKINTRLLCKRCLKSFHLTSTGKIVAGAPPEVAHAVHHDQPGHELDQVDHEIDVVMGKLKSAFGKVAIVCGISAAALLVWTMVRSGKAPSLDDQAVRIARALAKNDVAALRSLAVEGTGDEAMELSEALSPEFRDHSDILQAATPTVEVARRPEAPGPGLSEVVASIKTDEPVGRMGIAVPDVSTSMKPTGAIEVPIVLAGDDRKGWRLDGERSLEAYRKSRAPASMPGSTARAAKPATAPASSAPTVEPDSSRPPKVAGTPRA